MGVAVGVVLVAGAGIVSAPSSGAQPARPVFSDRARPAPTAAGPALTVDAATGQHTISRLIYGFNSYAADEGLATRLRIPIERWGGDATSMYNWREDSTNAGSDFYYMSGSGVAHPTPSGQPDAIIAQERSVGGTADITIPIIPWIDKSAQVGCSYPVSRYGAQQAVDPYDTACGNGRTTSGAQITDTDLGLNSMRNTSTYQAAWVKYLVKKYGDAAHGGVAIYQMDNEPSGWSAVHHDAHPKATGWDELVGLTEKYALAVKKADPTAAIDGPGDFGWAAYVDGGAPGDDRASHGGKIWEAQYYLQQLHDYQKKHGIRLLNYFDEHYYPTTPTGSECIALCPAGNAATQAARLQATRSLWDPTYVEKDWIGQYYGAIDLIPRMKRWIGRYYPGTKPAITEYNFGALDSMNGALAQADALGIFGEQDLGMACLWGPPTAGEPGAYAFRMYLDVNGRHQGFGDISVDARSADQSHLSVYAATRGADGALTIMVINKTDETLRSPIAVRRFAGSRRVTAYTYGPSDLKRIVHGQDATLAGGRIVRSFAPDSMTLLVVNRS
jgi:Glycoside hydrolase family 44